MRYAINMACAYLLLMSMDGLSFLDRAIYGEWDTKQGDHLTLALNLLSMVASLFLLGVGVRGRGTPRLRDMLPFAAVGYFLVSAAWSGAPDDTMRHATNYLIVMVGALGMSQTVPPRQFMKLVAWVCAFSAIGSLVLRVVSPANAMLFMGYDSFRGIFPHKNILGQAMAAGVLAGLYCWRTEPRSRLRYALLTLLFVAIAWAAASATALLVTAVYLVFGAIAALYVKGGTPRLAGLGMLALASLAIIVFVFLPDTFLAAIGKDPTLTGRTDLWPYVIDCIYQRPLLGWGFGGFWVASNPVVNQIGHAVGWLPPEAHNGGLDFLLQTGLVGTAIMVSLIVRHALLAIRCLRSQENEFGISTLLFLGGLLLMAVSEEILISPGQIQTMLFFAMFFMVQRVAGTARKRVGIRRTALAAGLGGTPAR